MPHYEIRKREWPSQFPPLKRPWGLYRDGVIIGMYETKEDAEAAKPPDPAVCGG